MPAKIFSATYYFTTARNKPGEACKLLSRLAQEEVNLLAFHTVPISRRETTFMIFPLNTNWLAEVARRTGLKLAGPHHAFIVHGDDELGALLDIHKSLCDAEINVDNAHGIADGRGGYRYILHVKESEFERAAEILGATTDESQFENFELKIPRHFEATM
jgi:hypothetical protein